jgi:predicted flap endonuclease-1-like 5' DNA nuclease
MRDRFISVAASREPEPPVLKSTPHSVDQVPIEAVDGIGPVLAGKLRAAGIEDLARLADASPDAVAEAAGVSAARARSWIDQARTLA